MSDQPSIPPQEAPVPPVPLAVSPAVARDRETDAAGLDRDPTPSDPPPGTVEQSFWKSPSTLAAIGASIVFVQFVTRPFLSKWFGEAGTVLLEGVEVAWAVALGVQKTAPPLTYK